MLWIPLLSFVNILNIGVPTVVLKVHFYLPRSLWIRLHPWTPLERVVFTSLQNCTALTLVPSPEFWVRCPNRQKGPGLHSTLGRPSQLCSLGGTRHFFHYTFCHTPACLPNLLISSTGPRTHPHPAPTRAWCTNVCPPQQPQVHWGPREQITFQGTTASTVSGF